MDRLADALMALLAVLMLALLCVGAMQGERRAGRSVAEQRRTAGVLAIVLTVWLALVTALSLSGVISASLSPPPRWPLLPLTAFVAIAIANRSAVGSRVIFALPRAWPIAAQTFRIAVELGLYALYVAGRAPEQISFEGRNFDVLVGLSAPFAAWLVGTGRLGPRGAIAWNVIGLAVLANTVGVVVTSTPGPLHLDWPGAPLTEVTSWPIVWLPAFLMPSAVFLHVASLRQHVADLRGARTENSR